jgi:hypothetical protein
MVHSLYASLAPGGSVDFNTCTEFAKREKRWKNSKFEKKSEFRSEEEE